MIFSFFVSFFAFAHIDYVGQIYISELLLALYLLLSIKRFRLLVEPFPRKILILGALWLLSQIVTDLIRDTAPGNYLRGWASIIFFLIDFCAVYIIVRSKPDVLRVLLLGGALGTIFFTIATPDDYAAGEPWKFGYGMPVIMLTLLYFSTRNRYKAKSGPVLLLMLGVLSIYLNARSIGGMTILTAAILYFNQRRSFGNYAAKRRGAIKTVGLVATVLISIFGILSVYQWAAESGYLPENVTAKYQLGKTKDSGMIGLIFGGRMEGLISSQAVIDSPIIGHGSWPNDPKYTNMLYEVVAKLGLNISDSQLKSDVDSTNLIPTHSALMQAWVWAGVLGAVFWLFVLRFIVHHAAASFISSYPFQSLVVFVSISSVWNLLFSPFGSNARIPWAVSLLVIYMWSRKPESRRFVRNSRPRMLVQ